MVKRSTEIAVGEAKARFSELLARAESGETITVKRHGRPIAQIQAFADGASIARAKRLSDFLTWRDANIKIAKGSIDYKALIDEGRR